jgi:cytochrome P450
MSAAEINMWFFLLVIAGNETTRNAISGGLIALTRFPAQRRMVLDDMGLLKPMAEEMVRWVSPVIAFRRTALVDTEIAGRPIAEGDKVVVFYPAANRDPRVFANPHDFDVTRDPNPHLGFGVGNHFCLGANLARAEIIAMYRELLTRLPDIEACGPETRWHSTLVNSIKSLPCRFTPH